MDMRLVIVRPFGSHAKGDVITEPGEIAKILAGDNGHDVVGVALPAGPDANAASKTSGAAPREN